MSELWFVLTILINVLVASVMMFVMVMVVRCGMFPMAVVVIVMVVLYVMRVLLFVFTLTVPNVVSEVLHVVFWSESMAGVTGRSMAKRSMSMVERSMTMAERSMTMTEWPVAVFLTVTERSMHHVWVSVRQVVHECGRWTSVHESRL